MSRLLFKLTPSTRMYRTRSRLLRMQGYDVHLEALATASVVIRADQVSLASRAYLGHETRIFGGPGSVVTLGEKVDLGPQVMIVAGTHEIGGPERRAGAGGSSRVTIGPGTWVGARAMIVGPATIGPGCVIAAGALVKGDVPANTLYLGLDSEPRPL